jgi:hypothetical protein
LKLFLLLFQKFFLKPFFLWFQKELPLVAFLKPKKTGFVSKCFSLASGLCVDGNNNLVKNQNF